MSIRKAAVFSVSSQAISTVINLLSVVLIARLLTPEELGVYAIASSIVFITAEFRLLGTGNFLIREQNITEDKKRSVLGLSIMVSWLLGLLLIITANKVGLYYNHSELSVLFYILSVSFFIAPFNVAPNAILIKNYHFKTLFIINVSSQTIGLLCTLYLIYLKQSYFSIAYGLIATLFSQVIISRLVCPDYMVWNPKLSGIKKVLSFGIYNSLSNLFNRFSFVSSDLIIGKMGSARDVALYSRGVGFLDFLTNFLSMGFRPLVLPYLSKSIHNKDDINDAYLRASNILTSICLPIIAVAGVSSYPIVIFMFGEQWQEVPVLVSYLAVWMGLRFIHILAADLLIAGGFQKVLFFRSSAILTVTILVIFLSYPFGLEMVARNMITVGVFDFILTTLLLRRFFRLAIISLIRSLTPIILLTTINLLTTLILSNYINFTQQSSIKVLLYIALVNIPVWLIMIKLLKLEIYAELLKALKLYNKQP